MRPYSIEEKRQWWSTLDARVSSATLIIEDADGRSLIVKANYKSHWTFPGGVVDAGETPLQAAVRETREEVGLVIDPAIVSFAWVANRSGDAVDTYQFVFRTTLPAGEMATVALQEEEIDDYAWISKADVAAEERHYGKVIEHWANNASGYVEQTFGLRD